VKICLKRVFPIVEYGGAIRKTSPSKQDQEKGVPTWEDQDRHYLAQVDCTRQRYDLDRVSFFLSGFIVFGRPGFRIRSRTIKRGSQVSNLIVSFGESSNLCILGISFLGIIWVLSKWCLELVVISMASSSSSKMDFGWKSYWVFGVGGFTGLSFIDRSNLSLFDFTLPCWTMMFLRIYLYISLLWFQRAQDYQKRSPDAQVITIFCVGVAASFWVARVSGPRRKVSSPYQAWHLIHSF
jgi:hypothetical protein